MKKLDGKTAIVTAASKGIGASIAKHLATEGAAVVVNYASNKEAADRMVDEITSARGKAIASINDLPIHQSDRKYHWKLGRPDDHPGLSDLNL